MCVTEAACSSGSDGRSGGKQISKCRISPFDLRTSLGRMGHVGEVGNYEWSLVPKRRVDDSNAAPLVGWDLQSSSHRSSEATFCSQWYLQSEQSSHLLRGCHSESFRAAVWSHRPPWKASVPTPLLAACGLLACNLYSTFAIIFRKSTGERVRLCGRRVKDGKYPIHPGLARPGAVDNQRQPRLCLLRVLYVQQHGRLEQLSEGAWIQHVRFATALWRSWTGQPYDHRLHVERKHLAWATSAQGACSCFA